MCFSTRHNRSILFAIGAVIALLIATRTSLANYPAAVLADDPLAYWRFNEASGTVTNLGSLGGAIDGTVVGNVEFVDGPPVVGLGLDNLAISVGDGESYVTSGSSFLNGASEFTITYWMAPNDRAGNRIGLVGQNDSLEYGFINPNTIQMWTPGGGSVNVDYSFDSGEWHLITAVGDGNDIRVYYDGELAGTGGGATNDYGSSGFDVNIGGGGVYDATGNQFDGLIDEVAIYDRALSAERVMDHFNAASVPVEPFVLNGGGETYSQNFDEMETSKRLPVGWRGVIDAGSKGSADSLGLQDGPLVDVGDDPVKGIVNVGGNPERFSSPDANTVGTWQGNTLDAAAVIADGATDRALGNARLFPDEVGQLTFSIEIADKPLRALVVDWDLEVWGGDPDGEFRGGDGAGYAHDVSVGGTSYYNVTKTLIPGDKFNTFEDVPTASNSPTLIDGNEHSLRGNSSGFLEIDAADGAIGNSINLTFDSDHGDADEGWIPAIDNVRIRAVAPGDVDGNGSVDPLDIVELLKGGQFGKGVNGVTWQQGDFNGDDQFDPNDLVAVLTFLSGEFPRTYASEEGNNGDETPDVIVDTGTGEVIIDFAGHTSSSIIIDSAAGIFNGDAPAWDTMGEFRTASAIQLSNTMFNGTESGVDNLGNLLKAHFMDPDFDFLGDLTVQILIATPDGPVTVDGHVIVIPEPSTWLLLGLGSLALVAVVRRRMA